MTIWRETRYPGYYVSDDGQVRGVSGRILRQGRAGGKERTYLQVHIAGHTTVYVHRLVVEAFIGPIPEGMQVAHRNGNGFDNRVENLAIKTPVGNAADKVVHGTNNYGHLPGEKNGRARLTEDDVRAIRALPPGFNRSHVAEAYGVSRRTIQGIVSGQTWRSVA